MTVGLLHPGAMGSAVGNCVAEPVVWASAGRSAASAARAAGFEDVGTVAEMARRSRVIISLCVPEHAEAVAGEVARAGFAGTYVDANAVAPATARRMAGQFRSFVDGGVIGGPPRRPGTTRLYLSGDDATAVAALFAGSPLDARVVDGGPGAASALKAAYAAWTKGSAALLLAARALAGAEGVAAELAAEWELSQPGLVERVERVAAGVAPKAWRFAGEMREIAAALAAHDLPSGFHEGAAEVYERLAGLRDGSADLGEVLALLLGDQRR